MSGIRVAVEKPIKYVETLFSSLLTQGFKHNDLYPNTRNGHFRLLSGRGLMSWSCGFDGFISPYLYSHQFIPLCCRFSGSNTLTLRDSPIGGSLLVWITPREPSSKSPGLVSFAWLYDWRTPALAATTRALIYGRACGEPTLENNILSRDTCLDQPWPWQAILPTWTIIAIINNSRRNIFDDLVLRVMGCVIKSRWFTSFPHL